MTKKIVIWFVFLSILGVQLLSAEEKFLSLKKNKTNVRYGPGLDYPIKYIYRKVNLPVKQIDKKENWRRVIFLDNNSGWIHWSQLKPSNSVITTEEKIFMKIDNEEVKAVPEADVDRTSAEGKASSVQFIHFKFNDDQINKFKSGNTSIELGIDHKEYAHTTKLTEDNIKSLSDDFI